MDGKIYHKAEYFDKKNVSLNDKVEGLTSATDRAKIREFMMDETSDFLDGFEKDSASDAEIKNFVEEYLTEQCLKKYAKSDPELLKVMVKEFVEEFHGDITDTIRDESVKRKPAEQQQTPVTTNKVGTISVEELRKIEY
jgi:hypothetical protein